MDDNSTAPKHTVRASAVEMTEIVIPNDTNQLGNLLGGRLMHWIDMATAIAACRHSSLICVTAAVDQLNFFHPIKLGEVVILKASVNRVFNTSMEVGVKVFAENLKTGNRIHTNSAHFTFVGLNAEGVPTPSPQVIPETDEEKRRFENAYIRRKQRLDNRHFGERLV